MPPARLRLTHGRKEKKVHPIAFVLTDQYKHSTVDEELFLEHFIAEVTENLYSK